MSDNLVIMLYHVVTAQKEEQACVRNRIDFRGRSCFRISCSFRMPSCCHFFLYTHTILHSFSCTYTILQLELKSQVDSGTFGCVTAALKLFETYQERHLLKCFHWLSQ